jgi:hypothetical protein
MSVKSSTELMLYVVLTMPTLNKAYLFIYLLQTTAFYNLLPETSLFSLATTDIDLARLRHSTYPSALVSACHMMN